MGSPAKASVESFDDIAPTALFTAYWRQYGNDPHAGPIFETAAAIWQQCGAPLPDFRKDERYHGPTMEIRQKVGDLLLKKAVATQVLDLGAGLSPRGLSKLGIPYVELDIPVMTTLKEMVLQRLHRTGLVERRPNHILVPGSALDPDTFAQAVSHFDRAKPVTVFSEGFLHYLNNDQRAQVATNVVRVLTEFGGAWVTDLPHLPLGSDGAPVPRFQNLGTSRDVRGLAFADQDTALKFFAGQRLVTKPEDSIAYADPGILSGLVSLDRVDLTKAEVAKKQSTWAMHIFHLAGSTRA